MSQVLPEEDEGPMLKVRQRRPFDLSSAPPTSPPTPTLDSQSPVRPHEGRKGSESGAATPSRTRSILNLTSSTLFGIYQPTGYDDTREDATPWGTGAQTPIDGRTEPLEFLRPGLPKNEFQRGPNGRLRRKSTLPPGYAHRPRRGLKGYLLPLLGRTVTLAIAGLLYGLLITHLHDHQQIAPVQVDLHRTTWAYLIFWAASGVILGEAYPRVDMLWESESAIDNEEVETEQGRRSTRSAVGWNDVVRSVGAFVGVAFAIRKLPWQSTLQLSLTLAMANPAIWYLIDRSPPGFALSTFVALSGTAVVLSVFPTLIPSPTPSELLWNQTFKPVDANATNASLPSEELILGLFSQESIGVATWIASVLFVSSICFGHIGRRLAPQRR